MQKEPYSNSNHQAELENLDNYLVDHFKSLSDEVFHPLIDYQFSNFGRKFRPDLVFMLFKSFGGENLQQITPWAALVEALHNATLVHDDIQDGDTKRRGKESLWRVFGKAEALNFGDFLLTNAPSFISQLETDPETKLELHNHYQRVTAQLAQGQNIELELKNIKDIKTLKQNYFKCIEMKTTELFKLCCIGPILLVPIEAFKKKYILDCFHHLGLLFQLQDDLLDLYGDKKRDQVGCDIYEGKFSSLIIHLMEACPEHSDLVLNLLNKPRKDTTADDVVIIKNLLDENKIPEKISEVIHQQMDEIKICCLKLENRSFSDYIDVCLKRILKPISRLIEVDTI